MGTNTFHPNSTPNFRKPPMTTITIDNQDYEIESLSDEVKAQLVSLQFCDAELQRLQAQAAVLQTARVAYGNALKATLPV